MSLRFDGSRSWIDVSFGQRLVDRAAVRTYLSDSSLVAFAGRAVDIAALLIAAILAQFGLELALVFMAFCTLAQWSTGLHLGRLAPRISDEIPYLVRNVALAMIGFGLIAGPLLQFSDVVRLGVLTITLTLLARAALYEFLHHLRTRGIALEPVVGAGPVAASLAGAIEDHPECGLAPIGFVDHDGTETPPAPYLGDIEDLSEIMDRVGARRAVFAFGAARESEMISIIRRCGPQVHFYVLLRFFELGVDRGPPSLTANIAGFPVRRIRLPAESNAMRRAKRLTDLAAATLGLIVLAPLMLVCAALVARSSPGPILFRQTRVGRNGSAFEMMKFRTMKVNHDSDITWSVESDSRVTSVGRVLRASHLDEIPQLVNVIRGDMSLVGPRPERPFFVDQFYDQVIGYGDRHRVKPGITGWSQINGLIGDSSIEDRTRHDNWYIEHWTAWADFLIMLRTIPTMFRRHH